MKDSLFSIRTHIAAGFVVLALFVAGPAMAQNAGNVPQSQEQVRLTFAPLVKLASPSVVNIYTKRVVQERVNPFFNDPFFNQFFGGGNFSGGGLLRERVQNALGSGVIVQSDGHIVTNAHVIRGTDDITVVLADGREFPAKALLVDERTDLGVLKIDVKNEVLPEIKMGDSDALEVGDMVLAIGNPFGVGQTVTSGIVSAVARTAASISDFNFFIQTDAAINPGNSGGALIDMDARLVGINSAIFSKDGGSLGIGFAIPVSMVKTILHASANGGRIVRPWVGIATQRITSDMIEGLGLTKPQGALVKKLHDGSPAGEAGLKVGDVVLSINGKDVADPESLRFRSAMVDVGHDAVLEVMRKKQRMTITFKTIAPPENPPRDETVMQGYNPLSGAKLANLSPAVVDELGDAASADDGVVVLETGTTGAARVGFVRGDIILSVNGVKIETVKQLKSVIGSDKAGRWNIQFKRGPQTLNVTVAG